MRSHSTSVAALTQAITSTWFFFGSTTTGGLLWPLGADAQPTRQMSHSDNDAVAGHEWVLPTLWVVMPARR